MSLRKDDTSPTGWHFELETLSGDYHSRTLSYKVQHLLWWIDFHCECPANHYNLVRETFSPACLLSPYPYLAVKDTGNGNFISGPKF